MIEQEYNIDPQQWFGDRLLSHTPIHFTICQTPCTDQSKIWIFTKLKGRFAFVDHIENEMDTSLNTISILALFTNGVPAFEDPNEALMYELTWA